MHCKLTAFFLTAIAFATGCATVPNLSHRTGDAGEMRFLVNVDPSGLALEGYDPVAYFTAGKPVKGSSAHRVKYDGAVYQFASAENHKAFEADPMKYVPSYGGYCGYAASIDRLSPVDPNFWEIIDGHLVLQHNQKAWDKWHEDLKGNVVKANANWPGLVGKFGGFDKRLVNVDSKGVALEGHDPVGYFTEHRPVKGQPEIYAMYGGATYYFASQQNREMFERDPAHYAPAFGGYCGYAASIDKVSPVNIHIFQIIDDRLVLQHTPKAYELFNADASKALTNANKNWPGLVARCGK